MTVLTIHHHWRRFPYHTGVKQPAWWITACKGYISNDWPVLSRPWPGSFLEVPSMRKAENIPWASSRNLLPHEETKGCKKILVIPTKTPYVIAIKSKDIVSISYFVTSDITPSQWNFFLANIHTWTAFHISKLISGREKKKRNQECFHFPELHLWERILLLLRSLWMIDLACK